MKSLFIQMSLNFFLRTQAAEISAFSHSGKSISAIIRKAVDNLRAEEKTPNRMVLKLIGAFEADRPDISVHHNDVL